MKLTTGLGGAVLLVAATIGLWGFAHRLYATMLPGLGGALSLTPAQTDMARSAVAIGYFVMTLPTAFISRNLGYKIGMLFGLGLFAIGIFLVYPAVHERSLVFFIAAAAVIGSGLAVVDVTALSLAVFLGRKQTAVQRTILVAGMSPLGALFALFMGPTIQATAAANPGGLTTLLSSIGLAAIGLAFILELVVFPPLATARSARDERTFESFVPLLRDRRFRFAVLAGFLALFAQILLAADTPRVSQTAMPALTAAAAQRMLFWVYVAFVTGRLVGPLVMIRIAPRRVFVLFSAASAICAVSSAIGTGALVVAGLMGTSFFMSILFPTIFADTLYEFADAAKSAAALLMFVAFSGTGAFAILAIVWTPTCVPLIMLVPAACFATITLLSWSSRLAGGNDVFTANSKSPRPS